MQDYIFKIFIRLIVVFTALPIHEYAHGWVANKLGDKTAQYQGRLDLNPIKHFDLIGTTALLLTGFGWAKPVPINPYNFRYSKVGVKGGIALTAAAGPLSNILLALVCLIVDKVVFYFLPSNTFTALVSTAFSLMVSLNIGLAVFNLIPIPPLDGSRILSFFLPDHINRFLDRYERVIFIFVLLIMVSGLLSRPIGIVSNLVYTGLDLLTKFIDLIATAIL